MQINDLFNNALGKSADISIEAFLVCVISALVLGAILANVVKYKSNCTKSFAITIALMPFIVSMIVLLVSDNFGAGLAIAGAFSLIRFRSSLGSAKEIIALFISVATGIACGTGYIGVAIIFAVIAIILYFLYTNLNIWENKKDDNNYQLTVVYYLGSTRKNVEEAVLNILNENAKDIKKKKTSLKNKKDEKELEVVYKLKTDDVDKLTSSLLASKTNIDFVLEKAKRAKVNRL